MEELLNPYHTDLALGDFVVVSMEQQELAEKLCKEKNISMDEANKLAKNLREVPSMVVGMKQKPDPVEEGKYVTEISLRRDMGNNFKWENDDFDFELRFIERPQQGTDDGNQNCIGG